MHAMLRLLLAESRHPDGVAASDLRQAASRAYTVSRKCLLIQPEVIQGTLQSTRENRVI